MTNVIAFVLLAVALAALGRFIFRKTDKDADEVCRVCGKNPCECPVDYGPETK